MGALAIPLISVGMTAIGGMMQKEGYEDAAEASRVAGRRRSIAAKFEAEQLEQMAGQSIAASQRDAREERRRADLAASRAIALAAASGGGASDTTVVKIISDLKGEGAYRSAVALYRGEEQARRLRMGAKGKRYEALVSEEGGNLQGQSYDTMATASMFNTGASLFSRYGGGFSGGGSPGLTNEMVPGQFSTVNPSYG